MSGPILGADILRALRRRGLVDAARVNEEPPPNDVPPLPPDPQIPLEEIRLDPRINRPDMEADLRREYAGGTPAQREGMMRSEIGPAYDAMVSPASDRYRAMAEAGPSKHKPGGFLSRVKDALIGAGLGAQRGGFGGMVAGGIAGAVNPDTAHRMRYEDVELPRAYQKAKAEQGLLGEDIKRAMAVANITGRDPYTGNPTQKAATQAERDDLARLRLEDTRRRTSSTIANQQSQIRNRDRHSDIQELNAKLRARQQGGALLPEEIASSRDQYGVDMPVGYDPKKHQMIIGADGKPHVIDLNTLGVVDFQTMKGREQTEKERADKEREAQGRNRESRLATGKPASRTEARRDITKEWTDAGHTPSGQPIENGYVVQKQGYRTKRIPLRSHPEFQQELDNRTAPSRPSGRHPNLSAAKAVYQEYVKAHPDKREAARKKFMAQNNGADPEQ